MTMLIQLHGYKQNIIINKVMRAVPCVIEGSHLEALPLNGFLIGEYYQASTFFTIYSDQLSSGQEAS